MRSHFFPFGVGQTLALRCGNRHELPHEPLQDQRSCGIVNFGQQLQQADSLQQDADRRYVAGALDEVSMSRNDPITDDGWVDIDAHHLWDLPPADAAQVARQPLAASLALIGDQFTAQLATPLGIDGGVKGLMSDISAWVVVEHALEGPSNLLRRLLQVQQSEHQASEGAVEDHFGRAARSRHAVQVALRQRRGRDIAQFRTSIAGHGPNNRSLLPQSCYRHTLFRLKLVIRSSCLNLNTLRQAMCCTSNLKPAHEVQ